MWFLWSVCIKAWRECTVICIFCSGWCSYRWNALHLRERNTWAACLKLQQVAKYKLLFCHFQIGFSQCTVFDCCSNLWFRSCKFCLYRASLLLFRSWMKSSQLMVLGVGDVLQYFKKKRRFKNQFFYKMVRENFLWYIFMSLPLNTILFSRMSLSFKEKCFEVEEQ